MSWSSDDFPKLFREAVFVAKHRYPKMLLLLKWMILAALTAVTGCLFLF